MSARVRVDRDPRGRLVAAKVALRPGDEAVLRREAELLQAARHPGVVECLGVEGGLTGVELLTAWVGPRSLAHAQPVTVRAAGTVVAALARTVAVLHERGLVHDGIDATHVLLDARGHPVLCSFGRAGPAGEPGRAGAPRRPAADVAALGTLLGGLVRTSRRGRGRSGRADALLARRLTVVADQVAAGSPGGTTTARGLAERLDQVLGPATSGAPSPTRRPPHRRLPTVGLGALVVLTTLAVLGRAAAHHDPPTPAVGSSAPAPHGAPAPQDLRPPVVVVEGRRYEVGAPGDQAAVADWRCDGAPIAVVHRPETGAVFVFERWAEADHDVIQAPVGQVAPGGHLLVPAAGDTCPRLAVAYPDGRVHAVALGLPPSPVHLPPAGP